MPDTTPLPKHPGGRPKGYAKTGGKPETARDYTCAVCSTVFRATPSERKAQDACCSNSCASKLRERKLGHTPAIVDTCALPGCAVVVKRYASRTTRPGGEVTGNVFCCREHFQSWRRWKASGRK